MNKKWLAKWKEYVNYSFIKKNIQYTYYYSHHSKNKYEIDEDSVPGTIDNSSLLVPLTEFYNDGNAENPENQVIRHDIDQHEDYKIVNKAIWEFFQKLYGGGPVIIKKSIEEKSRYSAIPRKIIEMFYRKVNK